MAFHTRKKLAVSVLFISVLASVHSEYANYGYYSGYGSYPYDYYGSSYGNGYNNYGK